MIGSPKGNVAQAERFENRFDSPRRVQRISLGLRSLSPDASLRILIVEDNNDIPSGQILGETGLYLKHGPASVHFVECNIDPWQRSLRKWAILNGSLHANAAHKMATHSKS
jgi:hypothetical protein